MRSGFLCLLAALAACVPAPAADPPKPLRVLLVIGGCCHDYAAQKTTLRDGIAARARVEITVAYSADKGTKQLNPVYESPDWAAGYDAVIHDECTADVTDAAVIARVLDPHRRGLPAVVLHCGMHSYRGDGYPKATPWFALTGLATTGHGSQEPIAVRWTDPDHPITRGQRDWTTAKEELYNNYAGKLLDTAKPLARGTQVTRAKDGKEATAAAVVAWTNEYAGKTRVFATTLGHNTPTVADPRYLDLVTRGLLWACGKLEPAYLKPVDAAVPPAPPANTPAPPLAPAKPAGDLLGTVKAPPGYRVSVFAAPPLVNYPTVLCCAPDGSVFVGVDPNGSLGTKAGRAKVVRCRDTQGTGTADQIQTFAEVDSPRGLWWDGRKTLYVLHPPFLSAFHDDDGDGKADRSEVLVSGLGMTLKQRGADHTINGFRRGIDGWFYVAAGDYGCNPAVGKDGTKLTLHGGGVIRVRPDGTGLERVSDGQRNIYDVAVSPTLDLFTRDNTNDGDGWDVRLSHVVQSGHYGYPSLYQHFPDELIPPMLDTGSGSPTGAIFLDEPEWPETLLTCEWGRSHVDRHPLKPKGASYQAGIEKFLDIPRPTDIDTDGRGNLYVSSWKGGSFDFAGPDIGFVARVTPEGGRSRPMPDFGKASPEELVTLLASQSGFVRGYAQAELLQRQPSPEIAAKLEALVAHESPAVRAAGLFTLAQLFGDKAQVSLLRFAEKPATRALALKALADDLRVTNTVPVAPFLAGLTDPDPAVRLQAAIGLGRLNRLDGAVGLIARTADADLTVAHVAVNALVSIKAVGPCVAALGTPHEPGALRALQAMHEPAAVDGLLARLAKVTDADARRPLLATLARLSHREATWDGKWWGTRPDTTGPYYQPAAWEQTDRILAALRDALKAADRGEQAKLLPALARQRVDLPEMTPLLVDLARTDPGVRRLAVALFAGRGEPPAEAGPFFAAVATDPVEAQPLRGRALKALVKHATTPAARDAAVAALCAPKPPSGHDAAWAEFVRDGRRLSEVADFVAMTKHADAARRELAYGVLATVADRPLGAAAARAQAEAAVRDAWPTPNAAALAKAVGKLNLSSYAPQLRKLAGEPGDAATAAKAALGQLKTEKSAGPALGTLPYEEVVTAVAKLKGDAATGAKLFARIGCVNCHAVAEGETLKGPLLAGIGTRYKRDELVESILRPSAKLAQGFEPWTFQMDSGKVIQGFVVRESGTEVEIRDGTGASMVLPKARIDERTVGKVSIMPEKLADDLTVSELAALLAYLESLGAK